MFISPSLQKHRQNKIPLTKPSTYGNKYAISSHYKVSEFFHNRKHQNIEISGNDKLRQMWNGFDSDGKDISRQLQIIRFNFV